MLKNLFDYFSLVPGDPFLQSCYFEKLNFNYSWEKTFYPEDASANWQNFSGLFQQSFEKSYQDVVLCEKYGRLLMTEGKYPEAKVMFEKALRQSPENPFLKYEIQQLVSPEKGQSP
jgi:tetratricopeptide (TPR) repeat protein